MEMGDYRNYIKIGEILRSPVEVDNQTQYILKCTQCIDMYIELESFVFPCLVHKETEAKNGLKLENEDEIRCDVESYDDCDTKAYIESAVTVKEDNGVDPLSLLESNISDVMVAAPNISQAPTYYQEESSIDEDGSGQFLDASNEEYEGMGTQTHKPKDIATPKFIQNFIKSEENIRTFMEAYKLHSHLLNSKEPHLGQTKKLHQKGVLQIKAEINKKLNLELTNKQISRLVLYMNRKFKNNLEPTHMTNDPETSKESESTKSEQYRLGPKHLLQVLPIYERFPFLWNSDLIEYCCKNQRREALAQMLIAVNQEMGLHEDAESLNLYILYIHNRFAKEKRRQLRKSKVEITDPQYNDVFV
ncbi:uncharacterized protein LOC142228854 [Haematobia irritans]|uniref:uncharacterized protein LOC142228854 n=1 Tax=Haematobia irritans TaxID=7368 RepID=UPI003F4F5FF2